jgi:hypothetical protein
MASGGFKTGDICRILSCDDAAVAQLFDEASAGVSCEVATDVVIIKVEPIIQLAIKDTVKSLGQKSIAPHALQVRTWH